MNWLRLDESDENELTEGEILDGLEVAYRQIEQVRDKLQRSGNIPLRKKYMHYIWDLLNTMDFPDL